MSANPLDGLTDEEILADVDMLIYRENLLAHRTAFHKGALAAKAQHEPLGFLAIAQLTDADKAVLSQEVNSRWSAIPPKLFLLCALCAGCAIVQGMDQTVINGAQAFYFDEFKITDNVMKGLINGAPYAAAALIGCWLNAPLNNFIGRRGTIAFSCFIAFATGIWQAAASDWPSLLAARFTLGLAVGAKSSTTPVYAAECSPKSVRGSLVMMWQMWTAFGIMLGFAVSLAFQKADWKGPNSQWRWMIGVTSLPPMIVGALVYFLPESPRWYLDKRRFAKAFEAMRKLRKNDVQAARDIYLAYKHLELEGKKQRDKNLFLEFFTVRRNWRAAQSAWFCMFMQQFCGVNVIAYYSTQIFIESGSSREHALLVSFGCGAVNFLGAIPAFFSIDRFGRRNLLLSTFPILAACLLWAGLSFKVEGDNIRKGLVAASIYIFMLLYSPGMGPVPFTYSAEAFPLHIRAIGMSSATAITWGFNFIISFTWPKMMEKLTPTGAFLWYAGWNVFGWVFAYFLLPETKNRTLEELDGVFSVRNRDHALYHTRLLCNWWKKLIGKTVQPLEPLLVSDRLVPAPDSSQDAQAEESKAIVASASEAPEATGGAQV